MNPVFLHMDMDAFFASVEELWDPSLRGKPVVVAGPGERSIITTASYPARKCGIRTGMTIRQAKALRRNIIIIRADYGKYTDASQKVMSVLESFSPDVTVTSVDEAFLDMTSLIERYGTPRKMGSAVKRRVRKETGLTCSIGIAENRLLAKLASSINKPDGLTVLEPQRVKEFLENMPVERLYGIGPVTAGNLNLLGIRTCGQLGRYPEDLLRHRFGAHGRILSGMGRGEEGIFDNRSRTEDRRTKTIGHSVTLPRDITEKHSMGKVLQTLAEMVGRRARRHSGRGKTLILTWRYDDFSTHSRRSRLPYPICLTEEIYHRSVKLLDEIDILRPVRLLGISLSDLSFEGFTPSLLQHDIKKEKLQTALDGINDRFGEFTMAYGDTISDLHGQRVVSPTWRPKGIKNSI